MKTALNHMTVPGLGFVPFLDLAARLGCIGVELRNDIARPLFDGRDPAEAGRMVADRGLRLLALAQVYPFNDWSAGRADAVQSLIGVAREAGAESVALVPRNDGAAREDGRRQTDLRRALAAILPMLDDAGLIGLVEPLGFARSSLRHKTELAEAIADVGGAGRFRILHDTFHHALAGGGPILADLTGLVHVSGVSVPDLGFDSMEDEHRGLIDAQDRLENVEQIQSITAAGYDGAVSLECFAPQVHALAEPEPAIRQSFDYLSSAVQAHAA